MKKDFDGWNTRKKKLHADGTRPYYHARELWWCSVGVNVGNELDGTGARHDRPVVILRPFNAQTFFGVSLIGHVRDGVYYFPVGIVEDREAVANLSQARLYDTRRLIRKIGMMDALVFFRLCDALKTTLFPENNLPRKAGRGRSHM